VECTSHIAECDRLVAEATTDRAGNEEGNPRTPIEPWGRDASYKVDEDDLFGINISNQRRSLDIAIEREAKNLDVEFTRLVRCQSHDVLAHPLLAS